MITWINFLHFYQPPTQEKNILEQVVRESYALIPKLLVAYPEVRLTINFCGSLIELLRKHGYEDILVEYKELARAGRIELVGSAMYHPILALLPENEIRRQITLQNEITWEVFGDTYKHQGFFIPEMAYSKKVADIVHLMGFQWIILDSISFPEGKPDNAVRYAIKDNGLTVLFRNRLFSKKFPPEFIINNKDEIKENYLIVAHDAELYGHWHKNDNGYYEKAFTDPALQMSTVSEYLQGLTKEEVIEPREASWEALSEELEQSIPFALWNRQGNEIHKIMWDFAQFTLETVESRSKDVNYHAARTYADKGLASCAWWWATGAKLVSTAPVCWSPREVEKGAEQLLTAVRSLEELDTDTRLKAEDYFTNLRTVIWSMHWKNYTTR